MGPNRAPFACLRSLLVPLAAGLACSAAGAAAAPELADIAARIEYGFFAEDPRVIEAARRRLGQLDAGTAAGGYYQALAAYRLALLSSGDGVLDRGAWLDECTAGARAAAQRRHLFSEAQILEAACSLLAARAEPVTGLLHERRATKALAAAEAGDAGNPRLALVRVLAINLRPGLEVTAAAQVRVTLERALEGFRRAEPDADLPDWGEAETLAHLGEVYLSSGETRRARDLIEEALLLAPDYRFAQRLMNAVSSR